MGGGAGGGFGNTNRSSSNIKDNILLTAKTYKYNSSNGKFGIKGKNTQVIESKNPKATSIDFYNKIAKGGIKSDLPNAKGTKTVLSDGTVVVHRLVTKTKGSPAVEIVIFNKVKNKSDRQKIHFILEEK